LSIRKKLEDKSCLFCKEPESVQHLFFECVVAKQLWFHMSEVCDRQIGADFLSIGQMWISNNKFVVCNSFFCCCPVGALEAEK
jgi:hypothetical protein